MALLLCAVTIFSFLKTVLPRELDFLQCEATDVPIGGGYFPQKNYYDPGDVIYYYCEIFRYLEGDWNRTCEYSGNWSGEAPFCDHPVSIIQGNQTSNLDPISENHGGYGSDHDLRSCGATAGAPGDTWTGEMYRPGEVKRVLTFTHPGRVHYEVFIVIPDGGKFSCGTREEYSQRPRWHTHYCPSPFSNLVVGIEVKSFIADPLQLCEVVPHGRTAHSCENPGLIIPNGYLMIGRQIAELHCVDGFETSPDIHLMCLESNVWNRKKLFCIDKRTDKT